MSWKAFLPLGFFVALVAIFGIGLTLKPQELPSEFINKPVPEFEIENLVEGEPPVTSASLRGEFILLNVFGSWCRTCIIEHPYLMQLQAEEGIHMVGLDWRDTREAAREWLAQRGNPYDTIGFDEHSEVAIGLGVTGAPETFLIDPTGMIRYKHVGEMTPEIWHTIFEPLIEQYSATETTEDAA